MIMRNLITFLVLGLSLGLFLSNTAIAQDELLSGGNMEMSSQWSVSNLNSQVSATAVWNYTDDVPAAGDGGCLLVSATVNGSDIQQSQFSIYQPVTLSADYAYDFDGAFKDISENLTQFWCEVYIGSEPTDGNDYNGDNGTLLAQFNAWNGDCNGLNVDGTFKNDGCHNGLFIPETSGDYYFVLKVGQGDWGGNEQSFSVLLDELSLIELSSVPLTNFSANVTNGYVPLSVQFTDQSGFASSWVWDFGDGETSTEQNPTHIYTEVGVYNVSLTATNNNGDSTLTKTNYITVKEVPELPVDGILVGGNMENESQWNITYLNTPEGSEPTATWNYTDDMPGAGKDGCLYISGAVNNFQTQYCIYQSVDLSNDKVYTFNGAIKDISENITNSWVEVYLGTEPVTGEDYGEGQRLLAKFSTWDACTPVDVDGTFAMDACYDGVLVPDSTATYYFVLKVGIIDWEGVDRGFDILIDQLSLVESVSAPWPAFSADAQNGFAPFTVNFTDESKLADAWLWDFGDDQTSTDQNPTHTYSTVGKYTVSLTVSNEQGDSTLTKTEYITVNEPAELPDGEKLYGGNMENPDFWAITNLNATSIPTATWNYTQDAPTDGDGGNLHVEAVVNNSTSQYCIWQSVDLLADSAYVFDGLFKDLTEGGIDHFWCEVYIGNVPPIDGEDYNADPEGIEMVSYFNTWEHPITGLDAHFADSAFNPANPYQPAADGTYYFVLKMGNTDWEATDYSFEVLIDELSLKERTPVVLPTADFFADIITGEAPLNVQFFNNSENAISYEWHFGDGETSTEIEPAHTYNNKGVYSVTLIAFSENASDTLTKENLITVDGNSIFGKSASAFEIYPNPANTEISFELASGIQAEFEIYNLLGKKVKSQIVYGGYNSVNITDLVRGIYIVKIGAGKQKFVQRLIFE